MIVRIRLKRERLFPSPHICATTRHRPLTSSMISMPCGSGLWNQNPSQSEGPETGLVLESFGECEDGIVRPRAARQPRHRSLCAAAIRSRPSFVRGPVDRPPCRRQRSPNSVTGRLRHVRPVRVFAPHSVDACAFMANLRIFSSSHTPTPPPFALRLSNPGASLRRFRAGRETTVHSASLLAGNNSRAARSAGPRHRSAEGPLGLRQRSPVVVLALVSPEMANALTGNSASALGPFRARPDPWVFQGASTITP